MTASTIHRSILTEHGFVLLEGDLEPLIDEYHAYLDRHQLRRPDQDSLPLAIGVLQAVTLWASFLPPNASTAWSILLPGSEWRLFACADGPAERCVVRWSPCEAEHRRAPPVFDCQTQRPGLPLQRSLFEPQSEQLEALITQFLEQSQQSLGGMRLDAESGRAQLLVALAEKREAAWQQLREKTLGRLWDALGAREDFPPTRTWRFGCGCDPQTLREAFLAAASGDPNPVFGSELEIEVECPRCGRLHRLRRP